MKGHLGIVDCRSQIAEVKPNALTFVYTIALLGVDRGDRGSVCARSARCARPQGTRRTRIV
jgi:hypothetical protein